MKIKLSKTQWEEMGKKSGWIKTANYEKWEPKVQNFINEAKRRSGLQGRNADNFAMGALKSAIAISLSEIDDALNNNKLKSNSQSVFDLGIDEIIDKINNILTKGINSDINSDI